ncbi:hypothetical protein [Actinomyces israelii]|uniref:hypothetical protein n=1 Tax=Actinomyces israelii TaxID=1659 RepID=UPI0005BD2E42|nr:hypothetical protein [Actinomyces israelii]WKR20614.1 hypothetical protein AIF0345_0497 [Actinomyces israelii]
MASKLPFIIGLGAGYVLGTRAGRAQYERLKSAASRAASRVAERPFVRDKVDAASARAGQFVRRQGEAVTDKVADAVKDRLFRSPTERTAPAPAVHVDDAEVRPID